MAPEFTTAPGQMPVEDQHRAEHPGTWLRLPCCEGSVHPVKILRQNDGVIVVSAPTEPHRAWIKRPAATETITLGWTDGGGTLVLNCMAMPETDGENGWTLRIISTSDFMQRRRHLRVSTDATVHLMDGDLDHVKMGSVLDISESGMRCSFENFIPEDRSNPFQWALKLDDTALIVLSVMRWSGRVSPIEVQAGFEFIDPYDSLLTRLRGYVMMQLDARGPIVD
jgi:hypothetical protein